MNKYITVFAVVIFSINAHLFAMEDMAVMMGGQQGASMANKAISTMFENAAKTISKDSSNLQNTMKNFSDMALTAQKNQSTALSKILKEAITQIGTQQGSQSTYMQQMVQYMFEMISLHKPQMYYLLDGATTFDEVFTQGTMYTPDGPLWKNIFQIGNWEYSHTKKSFRQLANEPIFTTETTKQGTSKKSSSRAAYNSIFTEYFASTSSYEILAEITINQIQYPFFVGIMFNKNRWISGNADSLTKCRLAGIYGNSEQDIGSYFAEQYSQTSKAKTKDGLPDITMMYPLEQIVEQQVKKQTVMPATKFKNIPTNPLTLTVRIVTSADKIGFKVWPKPSKEPSDFITIKSSHKDLYMYHGIGFMSPGAIAEFKLLKPSDLLFDTQAEQDFEQEVKELIASATKG